MDIGECSPNTLGYSSPNYADSENSFCFYFLLLKTELKCRVVIVNPRYIFAVARHIYSQMVANATTLFRVKS